VASAIDALDARLDKLSNSLTVVQTQASSVGSSLATVQIRQEFTKIMINTLQTGADNLTLADTNEEGANLLALNTRQQLSQTALSLASQGSQAVLRLFG
jgi:flagellin-like hook-associated protein FlgL